MLPTIKQVIDLDHWHPRCDRHSLEHPFFSLSNKKDVNPRNYQSNDGRVTIRVYPSNFGMPTIKDKDWLIYTVTLIREAMSIGKMGLQNQSIILDIWNFLVATKRGDGSQQYKDALNSLRRLYGVWIETDIKTDGERSIEPFRLIEHFKVIENTKTGKISSVEIKLCDWLYRSVLNAKCEMLSIHRKYFELEGINRRLYELARKYCGRQPFWKVGIETLWQKSGSQGSLKEFRRKIFKNQQDLGAIPDYRVQLKPSVDQIIFYSKYYKAPVEAMIVANFQRTRRKKGVKRPVFETP